MCVLGVGMSVGVCGGHECVCAHVCRCVHFVGEVVLLSHKGNGSSLCLSVGFLGPGFLQEREASWPGPLLDTGSRL